MNKAAHGEVERLQAQRQSFQAGSRSGTKARLASQNPLIALALMHLNRNKTAEVYSSMADELGRIAKETSHA